MLRVEPVQELQEKPVVAATLKLSTKNQVELSGESLILPFKLLDQILVQRY